VIPFTVIIPAAGTGSRSGRDIPKQYVELAGERVLARTIAAFTALDACERIVVAVDASWRAVAEECARGDARVSFVDGGTERQHSIANGLAALDAGARIVLVHDAARPCVARDLIERVVDAAAAHGAALPVMPIAETVKRVDGAGRVLETIPRGELRLAQTPQGFRRELIERAYREAASRGTLGTDDASLVEALGEPVATVDGDPGNLKITVAEDFRRAEREIANVERRMSNDE
jgi:2-C-methyl-D-erythritol 4-phosphate cytidylyltransferase